MAVRIGHASISENGNAGWDGKAKAGDQTGLEVKISYWYTKDWNVVLRPKDPAVAEKAAVACEKLCKSNLVGYDQSQRNTLHTQLQACGYDVDKYIKSKIATEADCSSFQHVLAILAGVKELEYTGNALVCSTMKAAFQRTGKYEILTDAKYTGSSDYLKRGDVLVSSGHTVMALDDGAKAGSGSGSSSGSGSGSTSGKVKEVKATGYATGFDRSLAGAYVTTSAVYMRHGAGTGNKAMVVLPIGLKVMNYGYYSVDKSNGRKWLYIQVTYAGTKYTGFTSSLYLKKQ